MNSTRSRFTLSTVAVLGAALLSVAPACAQDFAAFLREARSSGAARKADFSEKVLAFAREHAARPAGFDAALFLLQNEPYGSKEADESIAIAEKHHLAEPRAAQMFRFFLEAPPAMNIENLLRALMAKSPHEDVKLAAAHYLGKTLKTQAEIGHGLGTKTPVEIEVFEIVSGKPLLDKIRASSPEAIMGEAEKVLREVVEKASAGSAGRNLLNAAKKDLFEVQHLSVGKVAPEIVGEDVDGKQIKLSDYRGKVVGIYFWGDW